MREDHSSDRRIETCFWSEQSMPSGGPAWLGGWSTGWRCLRRPAPGFILADVCTQCPFWRPRTGASASHEATPDSEERFTRREGQMRVTQMLAVALAAAAVLAIGATAAAETAVERGQKLFADQKCSLCHAIGGKGNPKGPLDDVGSRLKADEIRMWIASPKEMAEKTKATRKPPMKSYPNLQKDDVDALVAFLQTHKKK
jgi:mono/diheme cytochrome c family protein